MTAVPVAQRQLPSEDVLEPRLREGTVVGTYRVLSLLGKGATCEVYLAEHETLGRRVALKMLRAPFSSSHRLVHRFVREARAVSQLRHEHIVQVTDLGKHPAGPYFIMELLDGAPLEAVIAREAPFGTERCLSIATQITAAMEVAHAVGIIHRDLKPENIFLVAHEGPDFVKVLDFGIAKVLTEAVVVETDTVPGMILGSPAYMSPEQVRGRELDHRTDIYSLGVVLYEMLSGQRPFTGDTLQEVLTGQVWHAPRPLGEQQLSDLDVALDALIMRCMAKPPDGRPGSMAEVRRQLDQIAERRAAPAIASQPLVEAEPAVPRPKAGPVQPEEAEPLDGATGDELTLPSNRQWTYTLAAVAALCIAGLIALLRGDELAQASAAQPRASEVQRPSAAGSRHATTAPASAKAALVAPRPQPARKPRPQLARKPRPQLARKPRPQLARKPRPQPARKPRPAASPRVPRKLALPKSTLSTTITPSTTINPFGSPRPAVRPTP